MEYKILMNCRDKYTGEMYNVGEIKTFSDERAKEILAVGKYIEPVKAAAKTKKSRKDNA